MKIKELLSLKVIPFALRCLDFSAIFFLQEANFCDFLYAPLANEDRPKISLLLGKEFTSIRENSLKETLKEKNLLSREFFSLSVDSIGGTIQISKLLCPSVSVTKR